MSSVLTAGLDRNLTPDTHLFLQLNCELSSHISELTGLQPQYNWVFLAHPSAFPSQVTTQDSSIVLFLLLCLLLVEIDFFAPVLYQWFSDHKILLKPLLALLLYEGFGINCLCQRSFQLWVFETVCSLLFFLKGRCGRN